MSSSFSKSYLSREQKRFLKEHCSEYLFSGAGVVPSLLKADIPKQSTHLVMSINKVRWGEGEDGVINRVIAECTGEKNFIERSVVTTNTRGEGKWIIPTNGWKWYPHFRNITGLSEGLVHDIISSQLKGFAGKETDIASLMEYAGGGGVVGFVGINKFVLIDSRYPYASVSDMIAREF